MANATYHIRFSVVVYIDDLLIMSHTFEVVLTLVDGELATLQRHGVKVKISECRLFSHDVEYVGHIVGSAGIRKAHIAKSKDRDIPQPSKTVARVFASG